MEQQEIAAANPSQVRFDAVYRILRDAIAAHAFPGCAFGVLSHGQVVLQDALGRFTYDEDAPPVTPDTVFDLASVTKVVATTAVAMVLYQRGQLDLDTPLADLLPGLVVGRQTGDRARLVTVRHLLAHSSGLPGYVEFFKTVDSPATLFRGCLELKLEAEPGARAEYSDPGFILLGKALEVLLRDDLASWCRREIFTPLGLACTTFNPSRSLWDGIPPTDNDTWFRHRRIQGEVQDENAWVLKGVSGHAGLFSNAPDLLRFAAAVLAAGTGAAPQNSPTLFSSEAVQCFGERQPPPGSSRALGWDTPSEKSTTGRYFSPGTIGHIGFSGCSLWIDREAGLAVVLLTNRTWPERANRLIREVWPKFHDAVRESLLIP